MGSGSFRAGRIGSEERKSRMQEGGPLSVIDKAEYALMYIRLYVGVFYEIISLYKLRDVGRPPTNLGLIESP